MTEAPTRSPTTRQDVTALILVARRRLGLSYTAIAEALGATAILHHGQMTQDRREAAKSAAHVCRDAHARALEGAVDRLHEIEVAHVAHEVRPGVAPEEGGAHEPEAKWEDLLR